MKSGLRIVTVMVRQNLEEMWGLTFYCRERNVVTFQFPTNIVCRICFS
jgi:hypothetical protein